MESSIQDSQKSYEKQKSSLSRCPGGVRAFDVGLGGMQ
jgi:hypothetical protein